MGNTWKMGEKVKCPGKCYVVLENYFNIPHIFLLLRMNLYAIHQSPPKQMTLPSERLSYVGDHINVQLVVYGQDI